MFWKSCALIGLHIQRPRALIFAEIFAMGETRKPQWVRCGECGHEWIGLYMPIEVNRLSKIVKGMCCPSCAADSKQIYMTQGEQK